jgi:hypothetical protein
LPAGSSISSWAGAPAIRDEPNLIENLIDSIADGLDECVEPGTLAGSRDRVRVVVFVQRLFIISPKP